LRPCATGRFDRAHLVCARIFCEMSWAVGPRDGGVRRLSIERFIVCSCGHCIDQHGADGCGHGSARARAHCPCRYSRENVLYALGCRARGDPPTVAPSRRRSTVDDRSERRQDRRGDPRATQHDDPKAGKVTIRALIRILFQSRRTMSRQPTIAPRTKARGETISRRRSPRAPAAEDAAGNLRLDPATRQSTLRTSP